MKVDKLHSENFQGLFLQEEKTFQEHLLEDKLLSGAT